MTFTRHWSGQVEFTREFLEGVDNLIAAFEEQTDYRIRNWDAEGSPLVSTEAIIFNGDAATGTDNDIFTLTGSMTEGSCETKLFPYDILVAAILEFASALYPGEFISWAEDGDKEENAIAADNLLRAAHL